MAQVKGDDSGAPPPHNFGVWGDSKSGVGVKGTSRNGPGVVGTSSNGAGVSGGSESGNGMEGFSRNNAGVFGQGSVGVFGYSGGEGVLGIAPVGIQAVGNGSGRGVGLQSTGESIGVAVFALEHERSSPIRRRKDFIGIFAAGEPEGVAGYFDNAAVRVGGPKAVIQEVDFGVAGHFYGNVEVVGSLSKSGGGFKIDHPLDPGSKYLSHSFVESSDMKNLYDGTVRLDRNGAAVVKLPPWCTALNRDFRYQLTAIGAPAPGLHVAQEIRRDHFKIAGGPPRAKVSWQVTGIRQDTWANAHRIAVEERKSAKERGHYLHPELVRKPMRRNVMWARYPEKMKALGRDRRAQPEKWMREEIIGRSPRDLVKRKRRARRRSVRQSR